jgi:hypothetical protein
MDTKSIEHAKKLREIVEMYDSGDEHWDAATWPAFRDALLAGAEALEAKPGED